MRHRAKKVRQVLVPERIVRTLEQLHARISERFPGSGLSSVCADLIHTAKMTARRAHALSRPYFGLQILVGLVVLAAILLQIYAAGLVDWIAIGRKEDIVTLAQGLDSAVNLTLLSGGAIWFLAGLERRWKRARALADLYQLRAFAHVIDMHQLTKDPSVVLAGARPTASSPTRQMTEPELLR